MSPAVRKIYFEAPQKLDAEVKRYLTVSRKILGSNDAGLTANSPDVSFVTTEGPGHLIGALDEVVNQYELESQEQVAKIEHMELEMAMNKFQ